MTQADSADNFFSPFAGEGEMCALMRSHDWAKTPLGPIEQWPQSLRTTVSILLNSRYPMFTFWGPELINLYNDSYRPVLGDKHPWALGQSAPEIWPEIWEAIGPMVHQVISQGEATWSDNLPLFMHRNGYLEETYFTFSYSPVRDESGGVGGMFCACTETTQQVLGDRRLRTLRDLATRAGQAKTTREACQIAMQTLASNLADIPFALLYLLDESNVATLAGVTGLNVNSPACPSLVVLAETDPAPIWPLSEVARTAQITYVTDIIERFGFLEVGPWPESPHGALVLPVASPGQIDPTGLLVAGISPRRALDDDYQGFLELVAGQVAAAIADARAYETERQRAETLAEIDQAKTVFFSNVSHEFRTPLTLMLAPIEDMLTDGDYPLPLPQRDRLEIAQRNSLRLLKLVNTLLDFSRIEAGRIQALYCPTDLASYTAELASTFRSLIERAGMSLVVDCPSLPEMVYVDRELWEKIVLNLLSNAFKYTLAGEICVSLRIANEGSREGEEVLGSSPSFALLEICDTGIGISPDELPRLFERFHRVRGAQGRSFEGTGIGLSLVQELVKLHGGHIEVSSTVGEGSCFRVWVPTGCAHLPSDRIQANTTEAVLAVPTPHADQSRVYLEEAWRWLPQNTLSNETESYTRLRAEGREQSESHLNLNLGDTPTKAHILLADDNTDMQAYVKRLLLEQHYTIEVVADGVAALEAISHHRPDLVLTDVMMPRLDGFGLLRTLRADPLLRELPIILLSARAGEEARIEGLEAGADEYLIKPFSIRELLARVEACLKLAKIRQESAQLERQLRTVAEVAQQAAEASANRLSQVLESMGDAFVALDRDWRITYQNAAGETINNGKPRAEVLGKTHWEEWPASVGSNLEINYRRAMAEQVAVRFEHHYVEAPDHDVLLEINAYPSPEALNIFFRDVSDRKRIEAEREQALADLHQAKNELEQRVAERTAELLQINADLQQSELVLRSFFDSAAMPMGIVELHNDDILHKSDNGAAAEFFGTTTQAMANRFASKLGVPLATIQRWSAYYREAERTLAPVRFEYCHDSPTGARWLAGSVCYIADSSSSYPRFSYIVEDITQRKQAEATLAFSEEQLRLSLEFTHIGTWDWDVLQNTVVWNDNHFKLLGLAPNRTEDPYQSWRRAIHPDDLDRVERALQDALHQHTDYETEYRVLYPDGTLRWLVGRGRGMYDAAQQPIRMLGVVLDISDRKRAEQIQEFQAVITRNMAEGICVVRADNGIIAYANRKFEQMFGYDPGELDGQHVSIVNYATDTVSAEAVTQTIRRAVLDNREATYEVHNVKKDGTPFWCSATTSVFAHPEYGVVLVAVQQDISDRKESEAKLQASLKEKELLLKEIYHRVKNNLQVIYSLLNLQSRKVSDPVALSVLRDSQSRVRAMALVHEKLYKSQDLARIDLADYIHSLAYSLLETYRAGSHRIALRFEVEPCSLNIETALPCGLILTELMSNSLKYAFPDGTSGEIAILSSVGPDHQISLRVQDNGVGLPDNFDLQQISSLGLSLVQNLSEQIQGTVVVSPKSVGSAFQITFPA